MSGRPSPIQCRCRQEGYGHSGRGLKFHERIAKKVHFQENQVYIFIPVTSKYK